MSNIHNIHGGDLVTFHEKYGRIPLDFSASLNPMGMAEGVRRAIANNLDQAYAYPDPQSRELTACLSKELHLNRDTIIFGNGAADLIHRFVHAVKPKKALLPVPTFAEYERALRFVGCSMEQFQLTAKNHFDVDGSILSKITPDLDLLFLCQPGNPTGRIIQSEVLDSVLQRCQKFNIRVFLDECFLSFVQGEGLSRIYQIGNMPNLFVLRSFTKLYGMAGLRLGYGVCNDRDLLQKMYDNAQPWSVSSLAQIAGVAALAEGDYVQQSLSLIEREKTWLISQFDTMQLTMIGSSANYIFFFAKHDHLHTRLAAKGILIRNCANFPGLSPGYYRIAVRTREENQRLTTCLREILFVEVADEL